jgi:hypothetical protein
MFDLYRKFLSHAKWTWNEYGGIHKPKRKKDRVMGRMEKRAAKQAERTDRDA